MPPLHTDAVAAQHALATTTRSYLHVAASIQNRLHLPPEWYAVPIGRRDGIESVAMIHEQRMARDLAWLGAQPPYSDDERS